MATLTNCPARRWQQPVFTELAQRVAIWLMLPAVALLPVPPGSGQTATAPTAPASASTTQPNASSDGLCYIGPVEVRVRNPDGTPAADVRLGLFGGSWYSESGQDPPPYHGKRRTDALGVYRSERERECDYPTFVYAFDEDRRLAGFQVIERLADLATPQTVQLRPARWVTGAVDCPALTRRGERCEFVAAFLTPILNTPRPSRALKYTQLVASGSHQFQFLVPAGRYRMDLHAAGARSRLNVPLEVAPGDAPLALPCYELELSPLVALVGQPAPPLDVESWSDGKPRRLTDLRGRVVVLCFWLRSTQPDEVRRIFELYERMHGSGAEFLLIHVPQAGGLPAVRRHLLEEGRKTKSAADVEYDVDKWPFPIALDRVADPPHVAGWDGGRTVAPYGEVAFPFFVLITRDGNIAATSQWKEQEFDARVAELIGADRARQ